MGGSYRALLLSEYNTMHIIVSLVLLLNTITSWAQVTPMPEPAKPHIQSGWNTMNLFWPGETDAVSNVTYACTYTGYVVMAESRLVAFGGCNENPKSCNGYHALPPSTDSFETGPLPKSTCMKYSEDGGLTWSQIRMVRTVADE